MIGATAVLAATTKGPVSAVVMMLELTHGLDGLLVPMLLAAGVATAVAHGIDPRAPPTPAGSARRRASTTRAAPSAAPRLTPIC